MRPAIYDLDKGERKEIVVLLDHLPEEERGKWLQWCCDHAYMPGNHKIMALGPFDSVTTWLCLRHLCVQHLLDVKVARQELERRVKLFGAKLSFANDAVLIMG